MKLCVRIFPHKMNGEGHFLALLGKQGTALTINQIPKAALEKDARKWLEAFLEEIGLTTLGGEAFDLSRVENRKDKLYYLPPQEGNFRGLNFLRNGLFLGELKKNRFEPSEPLALALHKGDAEAVISLPVSDERITRYLKGETILVSPEEAAHSKGWHLLCVDGYPLGFGKLVGSTLKNKYPAGWRING
jgi:NOL1/NOP2/fmu family ribosome biogenesis protein